MSEKSIVDQIKHYQKDILRCPDNFERMRRCIQRLYVLPIKVEHLQETGVGRSVNSLRRYKGEVGDAAKALVVKWKAMVAEEPNDEIHENSSKKHQDIKNSPKVNSVPPSPVKLEEKSDHHSSRDKNSVKNHSSDYKKHHSDSKSHHSENKTLHSNNKPRDKTSDNKIHSSNKTSHSSDKTSHSSSNSYNHTSTKKDNSVKNHKSHYDKKRKSESDESPPYKKPKKHHSHSRSHSSSSSRKKEIVKSESEEEPSSSAESEISAVSDNSKESDNSHSNKESEVESEHSNSDIESDSSSSTDHRHRSKHKSSHHKRESSGHSREKNEGKFKENKDKLKEKSKYKEYNNKSKSDKYTSKKSNSSDYKELIKENEKKIKKEKDNFLQPKSVPPINKNIKIELNEDGSIDSGCGASFADALLGVDSLSEPKKKKKISSSTVSSTTSVNKLSKSSSSPSKSSHSHSSGPVIKTEGSSSKSSKESSSFKPKTIDELVEPPELLSKKVKLEALDLDISSTLPEINLNYKPLPHIPENPRRQSKTISEEAMFSMMTNKNQRTKVYSGNKVYQSTVPSLFSLCIQLLYDNIDAVEYTGGVPYNLLKPLLEKLNADQLYILEHYNPYLIEDTDELWKFHCKKDFRGEQLQDMETWRELYLRCLEERERKLKTLTAKVSQSMAKSTPVRQAKLAYVDAVVKPPRNVARKQAKYGTGNSTSSSKNPTKQEIVSKAIVGGNTPGVSAKDIVPTPPPVAKAASHHPTPAIIKKKKAPLMQKALQVMKGTRYKR